MIAAFGPNRTLIPTLNAALQLRQTGHSLQVLDFSRVQCPERGLCCHSPKVANRQRSTNR